MLNSKVFLLTLVTLLVASLIGFHRNISSDASSSPHLNSNNTTTFTSSNSSAMSAPSSNKLILEKFALNRSPFKTFDPFLFFAYHNDKYPTAGPRVNQNGSDPFSLGPELNLLRSRDMGQDFSQKDGWSMYHGGTGYLEWLSRNRGKTDSLTEADHYYVAQGAVPGFPSHPHRGFETITLARSGLCDHFDSHHNTARYGEGDTQWMTAGKGIQHSEMFPLLNSQKDSFRGDGTKDNTLDLFQIWLNLPRKNKMCEPYFTMFWNEQTPVLKLPNVAAAASSSAADTPFVKIIAGEFAGGDKKPLPPPPHSYAADPRSSVAVWLFHIPAGATVRVPQAPDGGVTRTVYHIGGSERLSVSGDASASGEAIGARTGARVQSDVELFLTASGAAGGAAADVLLLQGRPIGEPVVQHGPFVMNTREEIMDCFRDYSQTRFGGWPWGNKEGGKEENAGDMCHPRGTPRHARRGDKIEYPPTKDNKQ